MSYTKDVEFQVSRTRHIISIYKGDRAQDLLSDVKHLPFEAHLLEWEEDADELILTFIEEKSVQVG